MWVNAAILVSWCLGWEPGLQTPVKLVGGTCSQRCLRWSGGLIVLTPPMAFYWRRCRRWVGMRWPVELSILSVITQTGARWNSTGYEECFAIQIWITSGAFGIFRSLRTIVSHCEGRKRQQNNCTWPSTIHAWHMLFAHTKTPLSKTQQTSPTHRQNNCGRPCDRCTWVLYPTSVVSFSAQSYPDYVSSYRESEVSNNTDLSALVQNSHLVAQIV